MHSEFFPLFVPFFNPMISFIYFFVNNELPFWSQNKCCLSDKSNYYCCLTLKFWVYISWVFSFYDECSLIFHFGKIAIHHQGNKCIKLMQAVQFCHWINVHLCSNFTPKFQKSMWPSSSVRNSQAPRRLKNEGSALTWPLKIAP